MEEGCVLGARDLVVAIFRLAVADYLCIWYGHDEPAPYRDRNTGFEQDAADFLRSRWAICLAEGAGFSARTVWLEACRLGAGDSHPRAA